MAESKEKKVRVIAHRGASAYAPENTIAAFRLAAEMKADFFELDCTLSSDGVMIVIHDDTLDRTTGLKGKVIRTTAAEIAETEAGAWYDAKFKGEPVPTLAQTLDFAKGTIGVYIEIKDSDPGDGDLLGTLMALGKEKGGLLPAHRDAVLAAIEKDGTVNLELTRKVIQLVRDRKMKDEIVIQSFSPIVCAIALIEAPEMRTELLASGSDTNPEQWPYFLAWAEMLKVHGFNCNRNMVTQELVDDFHGRGVTLAVWTVNSKRLMQRLAELGVDLLITDRPDVCLEVLGR
jgi:glycerophosphoryl diester phosphodiesterase